MRTLREIAAPIALIGLFTCAGCIAEAESDVEEEPTSEAVEAISLDQLNTATTFCNEQTKGSNTVLENCLYDAASAQ